MTDYEPLLAALREHGNVSKACRDLHIDRSCFYDAIAADPLLADKYVRAKEAGIDKMMEELLDAEITDASISRLEWDRKRWHASKLYAKKYGDKITHSGDKENPVVHEITRRVVE